MLKKSKKLGKSTSTSAEIQNISQRGIWILASDREFFLPFAEFPWFTKATISEIYEVTLLHKKHLHWPQLDVDIDLDTLKHLEAYPLMYVK